MAVMLITHAMGVVAETAQRVVVMYAGKVVEEASVEQLFEDPRHPYTQGLIRSIPRIDSGGDPEEAGSRRSAGVGAEPVEPAAGLPLRAALPLRERHLPARISRLLREVAPGHKVACVLYENPQASVA